MHNHNIDECNHENIKKLRYVRDSGSNGVHGPYSQIWLVRCTECGAEFEESIPVE